ncbi:hypothetical protein NW768_004649 [Fusarium equiseti]|uniref:Uncharacterized protein n=1 Tax=Fusarium equiseti TaxID=61235 RepID=A0ABQ8RGZ5_FUSEQ|nr:hypothetical protein NW768_004649 [Fusarium equiseti]
MAALFNNMLRTSDCLELRLWESFLKPIKALMKLPHPHCYFIAARMVLFLGYFLYSQCHSVTKAFYTSAAEEEYVIPLGNLCIKLDDALLEPLREIWKASDNLEHFDWVFVDDKIPFTKYKYALDDLDNAADLAIAQALSPSDRSLFSNEYGKKFYYRPSSEKKGSATLYEDPMPRWDCGQEDVDQFDWTSIGSDGPIRLEISYVMKKEDDDDYEVHKSIPIFRRSMQFCLDARQISEAKLGRQNHILLDEILQQHNVPREIHTQILQHLPYREPFPYLQNLDLAAAYASFPKKASHICQDCKDRSGWSPMRRTCPDRRYDIWNLPLRRFHVFHRDEFQSWSLCAYGPDCTGHHTGHDADWIVGRNPEFTLYIEQEAAKVNPDFISMDQVGLGPVEKIRLDKEDDDARKRRLFGQKGIYERSGKDWLMHGGLGGLIDFMLHGKSLASASDDGGVSREPAGWALGRNPVQQQLAVDAVKDLHSYPGRCEWCVP